MDSLRPYIVYSLSKDRTTQKFNISKIPNIIDTVSTFLDTCTTTDYNNPESIKLTAYSAFSNNDYAVSLQKIIDTATLKFGPAKVSPIGYYYPGGQPLPTSKYEWEFPKERLQEMVEYIIENNPLPKAELGSLELFFTYDFYLTDIESKNILPNQQYNSSLLIWLSKDKSCSPTLYFPFEKPDENFWHYIDSLGKYLPFKLEEKYLRLTHINKHGEVSSFKKINRPNLITDNS